MPSGVRCNALLGRLEALLAIIGVKEAKAYKSL